MSYRLEIRSVEDGGSVDIPPSCKRWTVLSETDETGNPQVAMVLEEPAGRAVA